MDAIFREIVVWLKKPRSGWIIRDIPNEVAETVLLHVKKVVRAAKIYGRVVSDLDYERFVKMALYHDFAEYREKDYLPWEISLEEKHERERVIIEKLRDKLGRWKEIYDIWMEFEERKSPEARALYQLDKLDAAVQALEYEKMWFDKVVDFYPDTHKKLSDPLLIKVFAILLKRKYPDVPYFEQYLLLLEVAWDEDAFDERVSQGKIKT